MANLLRKVTAAALALSFGFAVAPALAASAGKIVVFMPPGTDNYLAQWQVGARAKAKDLGYDINSLVFTIGTLIGLRGFALIISNENSVTIPIPRLGETDFLGAKYLGLLSPLAMLMFVVFLVAHLFLRYTLWGREIFAIGGGRAEARAAGVSIMRPMVISFALSATLAGLAGAVLSVRLGSATPLGFDTLLLSAVTACLIGGIALEAARGRSSGF